MNTEQVERELKDALNHLYDPDYQPSELLYELTSCEPQDGVLPVQSAILDAIERLKPPSDSPSSSRPRQLHDLLHNRFVLNLTLEETADRMHLSLSTTWRRQRAAVHTLARALWEHDGAERGGETERAQAVKENLVEAQAKDWFSQMERELASLRELHSDTGCDVKEAIDSVLKLVEASPYDVRVQVGSVRPGLATPIPASALRQALITALGRLIRRASAEQITVFARLEGGGIVISLRGSRPGQGGVTESELIRGVLTPDDVSVRARVHGDQVFVWMRLPSMGEVTVVVVDDNPDMARFYRRAAEGTVHRIVHVTEGQRLFEAIETTVPDIVVLDIMLPDVDGWELLMRLHEDPKTRTIPVVVCTVVREKELALSLGAADCLLKPVRPEEFRQALDRALSQAQARFSRSPGRTTGAG